MIKVEEDNIRIDKYLSTKLDLSRSQIQKLIDQSNILVNGKPTTANYKVKLGDLIDVDLNINYETFIEPENISLNIIYEDDDILIINKENGMVVHPAPGHYKGTLVNALLYRYDFKSDGNIRPGIVHRLDKDTSGIMIVAKNDAMHDILAKMIKNKEIKRHYLAIVEGVINHETGTIDAPIGRDPNNRQKMKVTDINGKDSVTHFKVLKRFNNNTLIECILDTGRTHQIRVHLAYIKHPVVNDPLYNNKKTTEFGQMLHSKSIEFIHPKTKNKIYFEVDPPKEFLDKIEELENE